MKTMLVLWWAWRTRPKPDPDWADTIALSWVTGLYARHGTDEQLKGIVHKWHFGRWK